jgi:predicted RND superfamily exporter protein
MLMSLGAVLSFVVTIILVPPVLLFLRPPNLRMYQKMDTDWLSTAFNRIAHLVFSHYRVCALCGLIIIVIMFAGAPLIKTETRMLGLFREYTPEAQAFKFVENNLVSTNSLTVLMEAPKGTFRKNSAAWKKLKALELRLQKLPFVQRTDSFLPVLENMCAELASSNSSHVSLFDKPGTIPNLLFLVSSNRAGKNILCEYVTKDFSQCIVSVRLNPGVSGDLTELVHKVQDVASTELKGVAEVQVTGHMALAAAQSSQLIRAQVLSLFLALMIITGLMMVQFRSFIMGLLSLIPNVLPLAFIFGIMGWFGIAMDSMTVLVAVISFGFSVDDTIHYLMHLRREIVTAAPMTPIKECLDRAYRVCAKALISTSAVFFFGLVVLVGAPFKPSASFGALAATAAFVALVGDLIFMPSVILWSQKTRKLLARS